MRAWSVKMNGSVKQSGVKLIIAWSFNWQITKVTSKCITKINNMNYIFVFFHVLYKNSTYTLSSFMITPRTTFSMTQYNIKVNELM